MIDLHCHILPGLDDGPDTWAQAIEMAKMAAIDGIYTLVATPHIHVAPGDDIDLLALNKKIEEHLAELRYHCTVLEIPLILAAGGEVDARMGPEPCRSFTLNGANYVLIEFIIQFNKFVPSEALKFDFNVMITTLESLKIYFPVFIPLERKKETLFIEG